MSENNSLADSDGGKSDSEKCAVMRQPPADVVQPMQFEIEHQCPHQDWAAELPTGLLPFIVWVDLGTIPRISPATPGAKCPGKKYVVPLSEANLFRRRAGFKPTNRDNSVCEHMGHLIE